MGHCCCFFAFWCCFRLSALVPVCKWMFVSRCCCCYCSRKSLLVPLSFLARDIVLLSFKILFLRRLPCWHCSLQCSFTSFRSLREMFVGLTLNICTLVWGGVCVGVNIAFTRCESKLLIFRGWVFRKFDKFNKHTGYPTLLGMYTSKQEWCGVVCCLGHTVLPSPILSTPNTMPNRRTTIPLSFCLTHSLSLSLSSYHPNILFAISLGISQFQFNCQQIQQPGRTKEPPLLHRTHSAGERVRGGGVGQSTKIGQLFLFVCIISAPLHLNMIKTLPKKK